MKEIILELLCLSAISSRTTKMMSLQPERMNIGEIFSLPAAYLASGASTILQELTN